MWLCWFATVLYYTRAPAAAIHQTSHNRSVRRFSCERPRSGAMTGGSKTKTAAGHAKEWLECGAHYVEGRGWAKTADHKVVFDTSGQYAGFWRLRYNWRATKSAAKYRKYVHLGVP